MQKLTVRISSFSYKKSIPDDPTGNGGGHVFDCRCIQNPGIYDEYKAFTGLDLNVQEYLRKIEATHTFLSHIQAIAQLAVARYIEREFTHIMFSFGCTGGQHRSVYFAEQLAAYIRKLFPTVEIIIVHREQGIEKTL